MCLLQASCQGLLQLQIRCLQPMSPARHRPCLFAHANSNHLIKAKLQGEEEEEGSDLKKENFVLALSHLALLSSTLSNGNSIYGSCMGRSRSIRGSMHMNKLQSLHRCCPVQDVSWFQSVLAGYSLFFITIR